MKFKILILLLVTLFISGCVGVSSKGIFGTGVSVALDPRSLGTPVSYTHLTLPTTLTV